jgi:dTDP-4-dehydrorhamnose 3,5-epimerase
MITIFNKEKKKDNRGYFSELYKQSIMEESYPFSIKQINESYSKKNTLRGLHVQYNPPIVKVLRLLQGHIILILANVNIYHYQYGSIELRELKSDLTIEDKDIKYHYIKSYTACGFLALEDSVVQYLYDEEYNKDGEETINVFDPNLDWNSTDRNIKNHFDYVIKTQKLIRSERDIEAITLKEWFEKQK